MLLSALFAFLIILLSGGMMLYVISDTTLHQIMVLPRAAQAIEQYYQEPIDWGKATETGRQSIYALLDRFSFYVDPRQFRQLDEEMSGGYGGIGVTVERHDEGLLVVAVRENGPAAAAGVMTGDVIVRTDSLLLAKIDQDRASSLLRGPDGSTVVVGLVRAGEADTLSAAITRRRIQFQHVPFAGFTPDSVIYLRLTDFDAGAADELESSLDSLLAVKNTSAKGVILDLRGNPGGLFWEAYHTANLFLTKGQFIVGTAARSRWNEEKHYATGPDHTNGLPMAVLVDRGSASSSEIVAGALHQLGRAQLVGDTTFGKGLVQGYTRFPDGGGSRLTISRYYLEGGLFLNRFDSALSDTGSGLVPDHRFAFPDNKPLMRDLESAGLLRQFALAYQEEIVAGNELFDPQGAWLDSLRLFLTEHQFSPHTSLVLRAEEVSIIARIDENSRATMTLADQILVAARRESIRELEQDRDYLRMRLRQMAFERKFGLSRAYAEVLVRERSDIRFAAALLKGKS